MVEAVRSKWCDDLESLLECPVCFKRPAKWIHQCNQGHIICQICKPQLPMCPVCNQQWSPTRNLLAEHLCSILDEIKISLIDPENEINKLLIPQTVSTSAQTEGQWNDAAASLPFRNMQSEPVANVATASSKPIDAHSGSYPCCMTGCGTQRFYEPLLKHLIVDHRHNFQELSSTTSVFEHTWEFACQPNLNFDKAFLITDMGTFFLKISSDQFENLSATVLMVHNGFIAKHHTYQIEITCCQEHAGTMHTDEVNSCRTPFDTVLKKSLNIPRSQLRKMLECDSSVKSNILCTVLLGKKQIVPDDRPFRKHYNKKKNVK